MNTELPTAIEIQSPKKTISLMWLVPLLAIIITAVLFLQWQIQRGPLVQISFEDASGLTTQSPIIYRGTVVGRVERISLNSDSTGVVVNVRLDASADGLAKENSQWWVVRPSVSLQGVQGLDTIFGPRYIQVKLGDGKPKYDFVGSTLAVPSSGTPYTLITTSADNMSVGAPLFYRGIEVGEITSIDLNENATTVLLTCNINQKYSPLVRTNSVFWNVSGIQIDASILGIDLRAGPLTSWIKGGIAFATPNRLGDVAPEGYAFTLENDFDEDWLEWSPEIDLTQNLEVD
jgi:paraquat-inducible protein B